MSLLHQIEEYIPYNEQEAFDQRLLLDWLYSGQNIYTRDNRVAHLTASGWVISPDRKKVLMAFHNLYQSWSWLGGHADGNPDLFFVAQKEIQEESGLSSFRSLSTDIFSLEILHVAGHEKRGQYVSPHTHLNVTYLFEADPSLPIRIKPDENSRIAWIPVDEIAGCVSETWMMERIYAKLIAKVEAPKA